MSDLDGKIALITGAGGMRGVGRATVMKLAGQGSDVALSDVRREVSDLPPAEIRNEWGGIETVSQEVQALGRRAVPIYCDLSDPNEIERLVERTMTEFGRIDILVNNARAIIGRDKVPVTQLDKEVWDHFLAINTTAVFLTTKAVAPHMIDSGRGGRIINIASNAGKQASANGAAYSASKFAVLGLTQATAMDLAPYNITVNAVCPGPINTDRMSYWERDKAQELGITQEEFRSQVVDSSAQGTPLGRIAESEDVANMVAFLAGDDASFITGQSYNVNGGQLFH
ncbi:MAG: SDR family NAD(P)-dependent oxidoreductase [Chloroflexota bacterium]|jgi:3-oxoacyl-[acyl-carrier protein] reductase/meso-butanediol dehydrogenase/(S,S)-butanediol dehydrogenase/diacetyl reductase|nr:MAG: SDR family oxidoreductase [SAR202 cluster bacterium]MEC9014680.1 SDR family NAD(P)-dependent oxidoreductase [Chloroflexota bacterium]GIT01964.1 MAG: sorbitol 6-phosphate dehydrogenase [Chloroflexota bacterium]|tara:strand:- start:727 stop:1578 length:852 start_codon:yes stop_codon:yes gene_type:complete